MSRLLDPKNFVADKLSWHRRVVKDPALSVGAKAVAGLLLHDLNCAAGGAWRGQQSMASSLGQSDRQIRRHLADLQAAGYLQIEVRRGSRRTNIYRAMMPDAAADETDKRTLATAQKIENRTSASVQTPINRTSAARRPDMGVRQFLYDPIRKLPARVPGGAPPVRMTRFPCPDIRELIVVRGGEMAAISYLDQAHWDPVARCILCRSDIATARLAEMAGKVLSQRGVTIARQSGKDTEYRLAA